MKRWIQADTGQDLLEYALVLPIFLLLVLGVIEFGLLFYEYNTVTNAAREGARAGVVMESPGCSRTCLANRVQTAAHATAVGLDPDEFIVTVDWCDSACTIPQVRVTANYRANFITHMMVEAVGGSGQVTLESTATMQREY